jgi:hypothetical protein
MEGITIWRGSGKSGISGYASRISNLMMMGQVFPVLPCLTSKTIPDLGRYFLTVFL